MPPESRDDRLVLDCQDSRPGAFGPGGTSATDERRLHLATVF
jgi:hypothetical protein